MIVPLESRTVTVTQTSMPVAGHSICFRDRKSTRLNSSHANISYAVFCLKKKKERFFSVHATNVPRNPDPSDHFKPLVRHRNTEMQARKYERQERAPTIDRTVTHVLIVAG